MEYTLEVLMRSAGSQLNHYIIFEASITSSKISTDWKDANITAINKEGDKNGLRIIDL